MTRISRIVLSTCLAVCATAALASEPAKTANSAATSPAFDKALATTQFMADAMCNGKADLKVADIAKSSTVFAVLSAAYAISPNVHLTADEKSQADIQAHLKNIRCDENGLLQLN